MALSDTEARLEQAQTAYRIHRHESYRTIKDIERELPFPIRNLVKTLVFTFGDQVALVAMPAQARLDYKKLADALSVPRKQVRAASEADLRDRLGFEPGGASPITAEPLQAIVLFDNGVNGIDPIFCGCGPADATLEIGGEDLMAIAAPRFVDLTKI